MRIGIKEFFYKSEKYLYDSKIDIVRQNMHSYIILSNIHVIVPMAGVFYIYIV